MKVNRQVKCSWSPHYTGKLIGRTPTVGEFVGWPNGEFAQDSTPIRSSGCVFWQTNYLSDQAESSPTGGSQRA